MPTRPFGSRHPRLKPNHRRLLVRAPPAPRPPLRPLPQPRRRRQGVPRLHRRRQRPRGAQPPKQRWCLLPLHRHDQGGLRRRIRRPRSPGRTTPRARVARTSTPASASNCPARFPATSRRSPRARTSVTTRCSAMPSRVSNTTGSTSLCSTAASCPPSPMASFTTSMLSGWRSSTRLCSSRRTSSPAPRTACELCAGRLLPWVAESQTASASEQRRCFVRKQWASASQKPREPSAREVRGSETTGK